MIAGEIAHNKVKIRQAIEEMRNAETKRKQAMREIDWRHEQVKRLEQKLIDLQEEQG